MANDKTLKVRYTADASQVAAELRKVDAAQQSFGDRLASTGQKISQAGRTLTAGLTLPIVALGGAAIKSAVDFESSFAGVRKTVDASEREFAELSAGLREMAKQTPVNVNELNRIAEAAGQLGIRKDAILEFTRVVADLGVTTNLTGDQAATALARIGNIMGTAQGDFDRLGSTIVALGNAGASTESEIVDMALRIAGAGKQVGLTESQVLGFANALSSVGIEADAGGSAISRTFITIANAVASGGADLTAFAKVAGQSVSQFRQSFQTDAAGATLAFVEGLHRVSESGGNVFAVLDQLGLGEIRVRDALLRAAGAGDLFRQSLQTGSKAWQENTALTDEASKRYETTASKMALLKNRFQDVFISLGQALVPVLEKATPIIEKLASGFERAVGIFSRLPGPVQTGLVAFAGLLAVLGPLLVAVGAVVSAIATIGPAFAAIGGLLGVIGGALFGTVGIVLLVAAAIGVAVFLIIKHWDTIKAFTVSVWNAIKDFFVQWWPLILGILTGGIGLLVALIVRNWEHIKAFTSAVWNGIKDFLAQWWPLLLGVVTGGVGLVVGLIVKNWDAIKAFTSAAWNAIKSFLSGIWNGIKSAAAAVWNAITSSISGAVNRVRDVITAAVNVVRNIWDSAMDMLGGGARRAASAVTSAISGMVDRIIGYVRRALDWIRKLPFVPGSPIPLIVWSRDAVDGVVNAFQGLPRGLGRVVAGMPDLNVAAGLEAATVPLGPPPRPAGTSSAPREVTALLAQLLDALRERREVVVAIDGREVLRAVERHGAYAQRART